MSKDCNECRHCNARMSYCMRHSAPDYVGPELVLADDHSHTMASYDADLAAFMDEYASGETVDQYATTCEAERYGPSSRTHCGADALFFQPRNESQTS